MKDEKRGFGRRDRKARVRHEPRMESGWTVSRDRRACQAPRRYGATALGVAGIWRAKRTRMETDSGTLWRSPDGVRLNLACAATGAPRQRRGLCVDEFGRKKRGRPVVWPERPPDLPLRGNLSFSRSEPPTAPDAAVGQRSAAAGAQSPLAARRRWWRSWL